MSIFVKCFQICQNIKMPVVWYEGILSISAAPRVSMDEPFLFWHETDIMPSCINGSCPVPGIDTMFPCHALLTGRRLPQPTHHPLAKVSSKFWRKKDHYSMRSFTNVKLSIHKVDEHWIVIDTGVSRVKIFMNWENLMLHATRVDILHYKIRTPWTFKIVGCIVHWESLAWAALETAHCM